VFGAGNPHADLMFVGEAPGFHEDKQGVPFVGQAGKLLDGLLAGVDLRPPAAARRVDLDLVAGRFAEQCPADRRVGGDSADAGDLDLELLAVVALELDPGADGDDAARGGGVLVDDRRVLQPVPQNPDSRLEQSLLVLRGVVLEVLGEIAVCPRRRDRLHGLSPLRPFELGKLGLELRVGGGRQQLAVFVPPGHGRASGRSRRSRRSNHRRRRLRPW